MVVLGHGMEITAAVAVVNFVVSLLTRSEHEDQYWLAAAAAAGALDAS